MEMQEIIEQAEQNIRQALQDYGAHTGMKEVLYDVTDNFITRLAEDSSYAKQGLRELFSKSPVWDGKLDALVINGTRMHDPDYNRLTELGTQILHDAFTRSGDEYYNIIQALNFFCCPQQSETDRELSIKAINALAPKAYTPTKKPSRVFKALCVALGVADETAGSEFQRLFAQFADEMNSKKIGFKLYVSINPAHFITMSNPKGDHRGQTLTSCHSFNSTEYQYNNGCSGYARDDVSFIVFTVADPGDPETFNNRKTTRQIFAYRPGSGLLLQSRMYNTSGGTHGAQADSKLYRDLVQREISMLENVPNLWKTVSSTGDKEDWIKEGIGFGGYADWTYSEFDGHISFRNDFDEENEEPLIVGTYGLCIRCGDEIDGHLYCDDCKNGVYCDECDGPSEDRNLTTAYDENGNEVHVCDSCIDRLYIYCDSCGCWHHRDRMNTINGRNICVGCRDEHYTQCDECGDWHRDEDMYWVHMGNRRDGSVCHDCYDRYYACCDECDGDCATDSMTRLYRADGETVLVCENCRTDFVVCSHCNELIEVCDDGTCPNCGEAVEEKEETA